MRRKSQTEHSRGASDGSHAPTARGFKRPASRVVSFASSSVLIAVIVAGVRPSVVAHRQKLSAPAASAEQQVSDSEGERATIRTELKSALLKEAVSGTLTMRPVMGTLVETVKVV
jgi:hypothetical protein